MPVTHLLKKYQSYAYVVPAALAGLIAVIFFFNLMQARSQTKALADSASIYQKQLTTTQKELAVLKNQDQYKRNEDLQKNIKSH